MFTQLINPLDNLHAHLPGGADSRGFAVGHAGGIPLAGLAGDATRLDHHLRARGVDMEDAVRRRRACLRLRRGDRRVERRLDYVLGHGAVQHAGGERRIREFPPLADRAGQHGRARADHAVRLGVRRAARRPGRLRLSVGGGCADPDFARHLRPQRDPRRRDRQQRAGLLRRARRADHRAGGRHRLSAAGAVGLGRHRGRGAGAAAAVGAAVPGLRQGGNERRLAARRGRLARLHRRPVSGGRLSGALSARRHRRHRVLHRVARAAQILAAQNRARLRRRTGGCGNGAADARTWTQAPARCCRPGCRSPCC